MIFQDNNPEEIIEKRGLERRRSLQIEFWTMFLICSKPKTKLFENHLPGKEKHLHMGAGRTGLYYQYVIISNEGRVEFHIEGDGGRNIQIFNILSSKKKEIEDNFGGKLCWEKKEGKEDYIIQYSIAGVGLNDKEKWPELQDRMIDAMIRLEKTLGPYIKQLG